MVTLPSDTKIAFRQYSDGRLRFLALLFWVMSRPGLTKIGELGIITGLKLGLPLHTIIKKTVFSLFCGGESLHESLEVLDKLRASGVGASLHYAIEGKDDPQIAERVMAETAAMIQGVGGRPLTYVVLKISGIVSPQILETLSAGGSLTPSEQSRWDWVQGALHKICQRAVAQHIPVMIDAEETWIQPAIDRLAEGLMQQYNRDSAVVFQTVQMYRKDRLTYLKGLSEATHQGGWKLGIKLVRGAYLVQENQRAKEKGVPSPICDTKADTDRGYDEAIRFCLSQIERISLFCGTHNKNSINLLIGLMEERNIAPNDRRVVFAQLLGMSDILTFNLASLGFNTVKFIPYGPVHEAMPYLFRRANENNSIQGQVNRNLADISQEIARRSS